MQKEKAAEPDYVTAWQCIGCGRIEAPQTCIGVCRDRKVWLIGKDTHAQALETVAEQRAQLAAVRAALLRFAQCTPRTGAFEAAWSALQAELRRLLHELPAEPAPVSAR